MSSHVEEIAKSKKIKSNRDQFTLSYKYMVKEGYNFSKA